jgi:anti-sigma regulatory factor (Ser/Thr protein kinase)
MSAQVVVPVAEKSQVGEARRAAVRVAEEAGLSETDCGKVAIVITELANNLARYAREGRLFVQALPTIGGPTAIEIVSVDRGPGMADVDRCLEDGFSTGGTPGNGLGAVRRLSVEFDIDSGLEVGTVIVSRVGSSPVAGTRRRFQWAAASVPAPRETVCGDTWRVDQREDEIRVMIADGLGHGPLAHEAAEAAGAAFDDAPSGGPKGFLQTAHPKLRSTRGAAVAAGWASASAGTFAYAGVGNIAGTLLTATERRGLVSQNGTLGAQIRTVHQQEYPWPAGWLLVMHSDGIQSRWTLDHRPGLFPRHPAVIAAVLLRDFARGPDDATVLVVRQFDPQA